MSKRINHSTDKEKKALSSISIVLNDKGLSLVEVLVASIIVVMAALGIYVGIIYAESQINRNYHYRVAVLKASGECDWQYYNKAYFDMFDGFPSKEVVINDYKGVDGKSPLMGTMTMEVEQRVERIANRTLPYNSVTVTVVWNEPLVGERVVAVREDIYR